jgi:hypothetical protein
MDHEAFLPSLQEPRYQISASLWLWVTFYNFHAEGLPAPCPAPKLDGQPFVSYLSCLYLGPITYICDLLL